MEARPQFLVARTLGRPAATGSEYAGFGRRLGAMLMDGLLVFAASIVLVPLLLLLFAPLFPLTPLGLVAYFAWRWGRGQTPGMSAARIRLVDAATGGPPGPGRMILRGTIAAVYYFLSFAFAFVLANLAIYLAMIAELGPPNEEHEPTFFTAGSLLPAGVFLAVTVANLWMLWDPRRQTLVDKLCHDVVVREPPQERPGPPRR